MEHETRTTARIKHEKSEAVDRAIDELLQAQRADCDSRSWLDIQRLEAKLKERDATIAARDAEIQAWVNGNNALGGRAYELAAERAKAYAEIDRLRAERRSIAERLRKGHVITSTIENILAELEAEPKAPQHSADLDWRKCPRCQSEYAKGSAEPKASESTHSFGTVRTFTSVCATSLNVDYEHGKLSILLNDGSTYSFAIAKRTKFAWDPNGGWTVL